MSFPTIPGTCRNRCERRFAQARFVPPASPRNRSVFDVGTQLAEVSVGCRLGPDDSQEQSGLGEDIIMSKQFKEFHELCETLNNLTPMQVAVVARQQRIDVPAEVVQAALAAELITGWKEGSDKDPDRIYLKTAGFPIGTVGGKASTARGLYMEVRALRTASAVLLAAIEIAEEKGYNTSPAEFARKSQTAATPATPAS